MRYILLLASVFLMVSLSTGCEDETISPCKGVNCANGTTCNDGDCNCPPRYEGRECRQEVTPPRIQITEVRVSDFPFFNEEGESWDPSSNPDVFFAITNTDNEGESSQVIADARVDTTLTFRGSSTFPITLDFPTSQYNLFIADFDESGTNAIIDEVKIVPYKKGGDFPRTISFNGDQNTKFEMDIAYKFSGGLSSEGL
jgi:hypothetical protein